MNKVTTYIKNIFGKQVSNNASLRLILKWKNITQFEFEFLATTTKIKVSAVITFFVFLKRNLLRGSYHS